MTKYIPRRQKALNNLRAINIGVIILVVLKVLELFVL